MSSRQKEYNGLQKNISMEDKIKRWNELTSSWIRGIEWTESSERADKETDAGEIRLIQIYKELSVLFNELIEAGINVVPGELYQRE